ncbi:MAG: hypothetical protein WCW53_11400 [Syntrophales bacterium]
MSGSLKLVNLIETHAEPIARQWARDVRKNPRTPSYHGIPEDKLVPVGMKFYDNFKQMFFTDKPADTSQQYFARYAEEHHQRKIPLNEALYALIMMRRHIWLYAEFQAIFISAVEQKQAVDSLVRTILMFDYAIFFISQRYQELIRQSIEEKLGVVNVLRMESPLGAKQGPYKTAIMIALVIGAFGLTYYYHAMLGRNIIFTHLLYIPIVLAGIWWKKKGILVAACLGGYLLLSHLLFLKGMPFTDDIIRAAMFLVIGTVVAFLSEGITRAEELYKPAN